VLAGPPSAAYRARKFVRRHRFGVGAAAASVVVLIGFAATMALQARRIASERDRAESVVEFQAGMLSEMDTEGIGSRLMEDLKRRVGKASRARGLSEAEAEAVVKSFDEAMRGVNATDAALRLIDEEILARAVEKLEEEFAEQPLIDARLRGTIGVTYRRLGLYAAAEPELERALEIRRRALGDEHPGTLSAMSSLGTLYIRLGRYKEAEELLLETLETQKRVLGADHTETLASTANLAITYYRQGRYDDAEPLFLETIEAHKRVLGDDHPETRNVMWNLSNLYMALARLGRDEEALAGLEKAIQDSPRFDGNYRRLAAVYFWLGRVEEAIEAIDKAIDLRPESPWAYLNRAGFSCYGSPDCGQVLADLRKALELAPENWTMAASVALTHVADLYLPCPHQYDPVRALELARAAVESDAQNAGFQLAFGIALYRNGRFEESRDALLKALDRATDGFRQEAEPTNLFALAMAHWNLGDKEEARRYYARGVASMEKTLPESPLHNRFKDETAQLLGVEP